MTTKELSKKEVENPYIEKLADLGFSKAEALIYLYLLEKGTETGVSKIAVGISMHRQQVYITLPLLVEAGIVEEIKEGKISKYKARPPHRLEHSIRRKMVLAEDLAQELQKISKIGNEQDFEVLIGEQAFRNYELQRSVTIPQDSSQYIIGVKSDKYLYITKDIQDEYSKNLKDRNIKTYYLGGEEAPEIYDSISYHFERRTLKKLNLRAMSIVISDGRIAFYGNVEPVSIYTIYSDKIAEDYKQFFMMLWEMASL
ncbi:MAG: helix-turn-helix domain-containing protein [Candidatus Nomurabacteria bacterium]